MKRSITMRRLLGIMLILAITLAPFTAVTAANAAVLTSASMQSMSGDMTCCPDEQKSKDCQDCQDCQDCPLLALCAFQIAQTAPSPTAGIPLRRAVRTAKSI